MASCSETEGSATNSDLCIYPPTYFFGRVVSQLCGGRCGLQLTVELKGESNQLQIHWRQATVVSRLLSKLCYCRASVHRDTTLTTLAHPLPSVVSFKVHVRLIDCVFNVFIIYNTMLKSLDGRFSED